MTTTAGGRPSSVAAQRRQARVGAVGGAGVVVAEPGHVVGGEEVALGVRDAGGVGLPVVVDEVGGRVDEQLRRERGAAGVAQLLGDDGGQVAARAVAADREPGRVAAELGDVLGGPAGGGEAVVDGGRERRLGREPVVDRQHDDVGLAADPAALVVVGVEVADDEAAAVEEHQRRERARRPRGGRARAAERPAGEVEHEVLDRARRGRRRRGRAGRR